jgi:hypothetical protein
MAVSINGANSGEYGFLSTTMRLVNCKASPVLHTGAKQ